MEFGVVKLGIVTAIVLILLSLAISSYYPLLLRSMYMELASHFVAIKQEMILSYLVNGEWPEAVDPKQNIPRTRYIIVDKIIVAEGNQDYVFTYRNHPDTKYTLSLRRVPEDQAATFVWVCGYGNHDKGLTVTAKDKTTVPEEHLPYTCR